MIHTFQDMPADMVELDPFVKFGQEHAILMAKNEDKVNGMTISWGTMGVLWNKNVVMVFVRDSRYTKEFIDESDTFSVNFFDKKEKSALSYFGAVSGRVEDKMASCHFNTNVHKDITFIDEANFVLVCRKLSATRIEDDSFVDMDIKSTWYGDGDYHTMYIGEIVDFLAR